MRAEVATLTVSPNDPQGDLVLSAPVILCYAKLEILVPSGGKLLHADITRVHAIEPEYSLLQGHVDSVSRGQQAKRAVTIPAEVVYLHQQEEVGLHKGGWEKHTLNLGNPLGVSWYSHASE